MKLVPVLLLSALLACTDAMTSSLTPPPPTSVAYCEPYTPLWVAFQNGDGAWTRALPTGTSGGSVFQYTFSSNRGGVATVLDGPSGTTFLHVSYGTPQDSASGPGDPFCA